MYKTGMVGVCRQVLEKGTEAELVLGTPPGMAEVLQEVLLVFLFSSFSAGKLIWLPNIKLIIYLCGSWALRQPGVPMPGAQNSICPECIQRARSAQV